MIIKAGIGISLAFGALFGSPPPLMVHPNSIDTSSQQLHGSESKGSKPTGLISPRFNYAKNYLDGLDSQSRIPLNQDLTDMGFRPLKTSSSFLSKDKLAFADSLGLTYKSIRQIDDSLPIPAWQDRISFTFGKLKESDFETLLRHYSSWTSTPNKLEYDANIKYSLIDFLPPIVKELDGTRFVPSNKKLPEFIWDMASIPLSKNQKPHSSLYSNCWGIAYEALRGVLNFKIFYARPNWMLETLRKNSELVAKAKQLEDFPDLRSLRTGDFVVISHSNGRDEYFDHTAIVVDSGIYFEKAGSGEKTPIRIIDQENLFSVWKPGIFRYEWRRPKLDAKWQDPTDLFSLGTGRSRTLFPGLAKMPASFLEKYSVDWQDEDDGKSYLSFYRIRSVDTKAD